MGSKSVTTQDACKIVSLGLMESSGVVLELKERWLSQRQVGGTNEAAGLLWRIVTSVFLAWLWRGESPPWSCQCHGVRAKNPFVFLIHDVVIPWVL